jgi:hypothetical protein
MAFILKYCFLYQTQSYKINLELFLLITKVYIYKNILIIYYESMFIRQQNAV